MLYRLRNSALVVVNPGNLDAYLPGMTAKLDGVEAFAFGRLHKVQRLFRGDPRSLAIKCDVIRAHLLRQYGGIYIDSDALLLDDLDRYFSLFDQHEFFIVKRSSHGKSHVSVNFYGSRPGSSIITMYTDRQMAKLAQGRVFDFTAMGDGTLNPIADEYKERIKVIPEREVQPVTYEEAEQILLSTELGVDDVIKNKGAVFMLFKGVFRKQLKYWTVEDLYRGEILLSKVIRRALPEQEYRRYRGGLNA